ncbi:hypothetical protein MML61_21730 [Mycobacterium marinum]|uniref:hypothetical protein n=1 Tax=Mycobacterium marinum TaxID=1781 RepID=UPI001E582C7F|nr:hypothetical protein [Mycobacterium marinum]WCS17402.1 hypothetical protein MML61_21730 [Mycobacterium marinum]WOR03732.1 hypothetical protein QDR78_21640 [Mycobacterium marinum]
MELWYAGRHHDSGAGRAPARTAPGIGAPVICVHGVPASSFLSRRVVPALTQRGLRGPSDSTSPTLNTIIAVERFHRRRAMEPFAHRAVGERWLGLLRVPGAFESIMRLVSASSRVPIAEIACWKQLLFGDDGARAFLEIMR